MADTDRPCVECRFGINDGDPEKVLKLGDKISCFLNPPVLIAVGSASESWARPYVAQNDFCSHWSEQKGKS